MPIANVTIPITTFKGLSLDAMFKKKLLLPSILSNWLTANNSPAQIQAILKINEIIVNKINFGQKYTYF